MTCGVAAVLPVGRARAQFPSLASTFVFADNAGGSQVPKIVANAVRDYLLQTNVQLGASYHVSKAGARRVEAGLEAAMKFVNAADPAEIVIGSSSTMLLQSLARSMEPTLQSTDEIIVTNCDHESNIGPWVRLAQKLNLKLKVWKVNDDLELDLHDLRDLLTPTTRLVAVTQTSNIFGSINDVKAIAALVHTAPGAQICVDGVAFAPHRAVDVLEWDVDYYVFSWYKIFGPHMALLYTNARTFPCLTNINHHFLTARPYILEPGNVNFECTSSIPAIFRYLQWLSSGDSDVSELSETTELSRPALLLSFDLIAEYEAELSCVLLSYLLSKPEHYTLFGRPSHKASDRVATVSFTVHDRKSRKFVEDLEANLEGRRGVGMRHGCFYAYEFCAARFGEEGKWDGVVRVSFAHYNTLEEAEYVVSAIDETLRRGALPNV